MAETPCSERHIERWERTEVRGEGSGQGLTVDRPGIIHRQPGSHEFLVPSLISEGLSGHEDGGHGLVTPAEQRAQYQGVAGIGGQTDDESKDVQITWTTHWGGMLYDTPLGVHEQTDGPQILAVESFDLDTDISLGGPREFQNEQSHGNVMLSDSRALRAEEAFIRGADVDSTDFRAEEAFMIGVDRGNVDEGSTDFRAEEAFMRSVDRGNVDEGSTDFRAEEAFMIGVDRGNVDEDSTDFRAEEAFMIGVDRGNVDEGSTDFRTDEAFMIGVDRGNVDEDSTDFRADEAFMIGVDRGNVDEGSTDFRAEEAFMIGVDRGNVDEDSANFRAEEAFMISVDRGNVDEGSTDFRAEEAFMRGVDRGNVDEGSTDFRAEEAFMRGVDRGNVDEGSTDFRAEEAFMRSVDRGNVDEGSTDFRAEEAFMIGVDINDAGYDAGVKADDGACVTGAGAGHREHPGPVTCSERWERTVIVDRDSKGKIVVFNSWFGAGQKLDPVLRSDPEKNIDEFNFKCEDVVHDVDDAVVGGAVDFVDVTVVEDDGCDDSETIGGDDGGVRVVRRIERSFSIGEDGKRSQFTDRLLERRKTIEVDKEDLSGLETIHTSTSDIMIGGDKERAGLSQVSEINVIWGKTVEADLDPEGDAKMGSPITDMLASPIDSWTGSSVGDTDTGEYWSGDVSTDTVVTSSSFDSMYACDSNGSHHDSGLEYPSSANSSRRGPVHITPHAVSRLERSEAFHFLPDQQASPLQPRSITVWEGDSGQVLTISSEPGAPYTLAMDNIFVSTLDISSRRGSQHRDSETLEEPRGARNNERSSVRALFKNSDDIDILKLPSERDSSLDENVSRLSPTVTITDVPEIIIPIAERANYVDRREEYLHDIDELPQFTRHSMSDGRSWLPHLQTYSSMVADNHTGFSGLPTAAAGEGKERLSPDFSKTFENEKFVPLASRKKKKLKKKKKMKGEQNYTAETEESSGFKTEIEDKPQPMPGTIEAEGMSQGVRTRADYDSEQINTGAERHATEFLENNPIKTYVSEELDVRGTKDTDNTHSDGSKLDFIDFDDADSSPTITEKRRKKIHDSKSSESAKASADDEDKTLGEVTGVKNDEGGEATPPDHAQDYLNQLFQSAAVDPATLLLHSEDHDGDVLLNVSKGRRRILKPHRRFTKRGRDDTEPAEISQLPTPRSDDPTKKDDLGRESPQAGPLSVHNEDTAGLGEDDCGGEGEMWRRKRVAGDQSKGTEVLDIDLTSNVDVAKGDHIKNIHDISISNEAENSNSNRRKSEFSSEVVRVAAHSSDGVCAKVWDATTDTADVHAEIDINTADTKNIPDDTTNTHAEIDVTVETRDIPADTIDAHAEIAISAETRDIRADTIDDNAEIDVTDETRDVPADSTDVHGEIGVIVPDDLTPSDENFAHALDIMFQPCDEPPSAAGDVISEENHHLSRDRRVVSSEEDVLRASDNEIWDNEDDKDDDQPSIAVVPGIDASKLESGASLSEGKQPENRDDPTSSTLDAVPGSLSGTDLKAGKDLKVLHPQDPEENPLLWPKKGKKKKRKKSKKEKEKQLFGLTGALQGITAESGDGDEDGGVGSQPVISGGNQENADGGSSTLHKITDICQNISVSPRDQSVDRKELFYDCRMESPKTLHRVKNNNFDTQVRVRLPEEQFLELHRADSPSSVACPDDAEDVSAGIAAATAAVDVGETGNGGGTGSELTHVLKGTSIQYADHQVNYHTDAAAVDCIESKVAEAGDVLDAVGVSAIAAHVSGQTIVTAGVAADKDQRIIYSDVVDAHNGSSDAFTSRYDNINVHWQDFSVGEPISCDDAYVIVSGNETTAAVDADAGNIAKVAADTPKFRLKGIENVAGADTDYNKIINIGNENIDGDAAEIGGIETIGSDTTIVGGKETLDSDTIDVGGKETIDSYTTDAGGKETIDSDTTDVNGKETIDSDSIDVGDKEAVDSDTTDVGGKETVNVCSKETIDSDTTDDVSKETIDSDTTDVGGKKTIDSDTTDVGGKKTIDSDTTDVGGKKTIDSDTTDIGGKKTIDSDTTDVGSKETIGGNTEDVDGNDSIDVDDGRKLDDLIKELVSDADIVSVRDIRIYIDDDPVESIDAIPSKEDIESNLPCNEKWPISGAESECIGMKSNLRPDGIYDDKGSIGDVHSATKYDTSTEDTNFASENVIAEDVPDKELRISSPGLEPSLVTEPLAALASGEDRRDGKKKKRKRKKQKVTAENVDSVHGQEDRENPREKRGENLMSPHPGGSGSAQALQVDTDPNLPELSVPGGQGAASSDVLIEAVGGQNIKDPLADQDVCQDVEEVTDRSVKSDQDWTLVSQYVDRREDHEPVSRPDVLTRVRLPRPPSRIFASSVAVV